MLEDIDGFRFTCIRGCINCCNQKGWVYLNQDDLERAAAFLKMSPAEFESRYVVRYRRRMRLRKSPNSQCHFLHAEGCSIHVAKPAQCRLFPFWPEIVESRAQRRAVAKYCPGLGQGPLIQIGTALETAHEMKSAYPELYGAKLPLPR